MGRTSPQSQLTNCGDKFPSSGGRRPVREPDKDISEFSDTMPPQCFGTK
jgi:hypothetical protein